MLLFARSSNPRVNRRRGAGGVPSPVLNYGKRAKTHTIQRRRLCTFSRSVSDAVDQSICIVCPFLLLDRVTKSPIYQHASSWHILPTPTLLYFCPTQTNLYSLQLTCTRLVRLRLAIASQPRCTLPGDSFLMRVYWAGLVSSRAFRICSFPRVVRPSGGTTGCSSSARPPAAGKDPDSCSGRLFPPPCNAGMSRSGCPVRATLEELVAGKACSSRSSCFRRGCRPHSPLRSSQELRPGSS